MSDSRPIGVFDSGVGGLTVLQELRRQLPGESLVYLADLERFPYGPRPLAEVRERAFLVIEHLAEHDIKLVVIACNTATAAALNAARERFDIPIVGVIAPGAQAAAAATRNGRVAVISTQGTLDSGEYVHAIKEANPGIAVLGLAAPALVDIVEAGDAGTPRADEALRPLVDDIIEWGADTLVLGCTHYPLLRPSLRRAVARRRLRVIDSAETTASRVRRVIAANRLQNTAAGPAPAPRVLVTGPPARFVDTAARLFRSDLESPVAVRLQPPLAVAR
ncbi:MAG: glutamate racemase [Candidatus Dormibacteraeota bacterium]|nr:glutamate racemase [Candidatus Dormibacteraeota bacterium]MBV9525398.1 glutamate racemase [Candidatus Dormibacteraeota bacterium]